MRTSRILGTSALVAITVVGATAWAEAGTLTPIAAFPGATSTGVLAINDSHEITGGYYTADGMEHGFFGTLGGGAASYTSFDIGAGGTEGRAINDSGTIMGFTNSVSGDQTTFGEFERDPAGAVTMVTNNGVPITGIVQGINSSGTFVGGSWTLPDYTEQAYYGSDGSYVSALSLAPTVVTHNTEPRGINDSGTVVGWYTSGGLTHGFILSGGTVYTVDDPNPANAGYTYLEGINNSGLMVGQWSDTNGLQHSFLLSPDRTTFTDINIPGATWVQTFGLNNANEVMLSSDIGSFVYNPATSPGVPPATAVFMPLSGGTDTFQFQFNVVTGTTVYIDPAYAAGYDYKIGAGDPTFASVTPPAGIDGNQYDLIVCNSTCVDTGILITGGTTFDFLSNGWASGLAEFKLEGIGLSAHLDPNDTTAFVTGLTFDGSGLFDGTMTAITTCAGAFIVSGQQLDVGSTDVSGCQITSNGGVLTASSSVAISNPVQIDPFGMVVSPPGGIALTLNGVIAGIGSLVADGAGTTILTGTNTYSGGTTILAGTLSVGADNNLGAASGGLTLGGGTLATTATFSSARSVSLAATSAIDAAPGTALTLTGVISGAGGLNKLDTGTLILTGVDTYTGTTDVQRGQLSNDGTITGLVTVERGAILRGTGIFKGAVTNNGTVAPGNSPGTMIFGAPLNLSASGSLEIDIDGTGTGNGAGNYSRLVFQGTGATLTAGGAILPLLRGITGSANNNYTPPVGQSFNIVHTDAGVTGSFASIAQPATGLLAGTQFDALYNGTDVDLVVTPISYANTAPFGGTDTPNRKSLGTSIDSYRLAPGLRMTGDRNTDLTALYSLAASAIGPVMDQIAGTVHGDTLNTAVSVDRMFASAIVDHRSGFDVSAGNVLAAPEPASLIDASPVWGRVIGQWSATGTDANAPGYREDAGGLLLGIDLSR